MINSVCLRDSSRARRQKSAMSLSLIHISGGAEKVWLGLKPGLPTVTDVLEVLQSVVNVEKAEVMEPEDGTTPEIFDAFERALPGLTLEPVSYTHLNHRTTYGHAHRTSPMPEGVPFLRPKSE